MSIHEHHRVHRVGWLRAAVLGANDGIVSTASLIIGVASASASQESVLLAGVAGLVAGSMSMAAGEYVSVSSQADTEKADLAIEERSLEHNYELEVDELAEFLDDRPKARDLFQRYLRVAPSSGEHREMAEQYVRDIEPPAAAAPPAAGGES